MKITMLSALALLSIATLSAQKPDVESKDVEVTFNRPEQLSSFNTISYTLQDDGDFWNYEGTDAKPTLTSVTNGITVPGLENVTENADLNFIVAYKGAKPVKVPALYQIEGSYLFLVTTKDNEILSREEDYVINNINFSEYDFSTKVKAKESYARFVTDYANEHINGLSYLLSGKSNEKLPFAVFKKTKGGAAEDFTIASEPLIAAIIANPESKEALGNAIKYWESQLATDFGKKVKDKVKNKVIYTNLTSASLLAGDYDSATKYFDVVDENTGFFDLWKGNLKSALEKTKTLNTFAKGEMQKIDTTASNYAYFYTFKDAIFQYKKKDPVQSTMVTVERFVPEVSSGMASLDKGKRPEIKVYVDGEIKWNYTGDDNVDIKTADGKHIVFRNHKGTFIPFVEQPDGTYSALEFADSINITLEEE